MGKCSPALSDAGEHARAHTTVLTSHTCAHAFAHAYTHVHIHPHTVGCTSTTCKKHNPPIHLRERTRTHTCTYTHFRPHTTFTHTHAHTNKSTPTHTHPHTYARTLQTVPERHDPGAGDPGYGPAHCARVPERAAAPLYPPGRAGPSQDLLLHVRGPGQGTKTHTCCTYTQISHTHAQTSTA